MTVKGKKKKKSPRRSLAFRITLVILCILMILATIARIIQYYRLVTR